MGKEAGQERKTATKIDRVSMKLPSVYLSRGLIIYTPRIVRKGRSRTRFPARDPSSIWSQRSVPTKVARLQPSARSCQINMASCIEHGHPVRGVGHPVSLEVDRPFQQCQRTLRHNNPIPSGHGHHVLPLLSCTFEEPTHFIQSCPILKQRLNCSKAMANQRNTITSQLVRGDEKGTAVRRCPGIKSVDSTSSTRAQKRSQAGLCCAKSMTLCPGNLT